MPAPPHPEVIAVEAVYDALPRIAGRAEEVGPFTLFLRTDPASHPYYARPRLGGTGPITLEDVRAVRARQRELGAPETLEWVQEVTPSLADAATADGMSLERYPLMVLDGVVSAPQPAGVDVRLLGPGDDIATADAVAHVGFGSPGTDRGDAGPDERDAAVTQGQRDRAALLAQRIADGSFGMAAAYDPEQGPLCVGAYQCTPAGGELVGVATLPVARRRGLGAAVSAVLAADLRERGIELVFLGASDEAVARVYAGVGFRRIGTACAAEPA